MSLECEFEEMETHTNSVYAMVTEDDDTEPDYEDLQDIDC